MKMGTVRLKFHMEFELPGKLSSGDRKRIAALRDAVAYLNGLAGLEDGVTADRHHFADVTDVMVSLASVCRRARAVNR